jgi:hypothetical protein
VSAPAAIRSGRHTADNFRAAIQFWDPGYFLTSQRYHQMMTEVEANSVLGYAQPAAGYRRWFGTVLVTVLSPAVGLRNRFDTYGTEINDSSISLRLEFPAARVVQRGPERELIPDPQTMALILGGDAQTLSWSYVLTDFPQLHTDENAMTSTMTLTWARVDGSRADRR